jgi:hypothetical protein
MAGLDSNTKLYSSFNTAIVDNYGGHTLTAQNGAAISTSQSKFGTGSLYVRDNENDYVTIPYSADFDIGSNDFSFDCQVYFDDLPANPPANNGYNNALYLIDTDGFKFAVANTYNSGVYTLTLSCLYYYGVSSYELIEADVGAELTADAWHHIVLDREGNTMFLRIDGNIVARAYLTSAKRTAYNNSSNISLAKEYATSGDPHAGNAYINELRFVNGADEYNTPNFTPPTAAPSVDSNDVLVLNMEGADDSTTFTDSSTANTKTVTANGNAKIKTSYATGVGSAPVGDNCGLFNGASYLSVPDSSDFTFGSGDFTLECWMYANSIHATQGIQFLNHLSLGTIQGYHFNIDPNGTVRFQPYNGGVAGTVALTSSGKFTTGSWHHLAVVGDGSTIKIYVNGVQEASVTASAIGDASTVVKIGTAWTNAAYLNGAMDELRISDTTRYTSNFTPSTTPFTDDANTLLLLHFEDDFDDASSYERTITNSSVEFPVNITPKVGSGMAFFDGSDYLTVPDSSDFYFDDGEYTLEYYLYALNAGVGIQIVNHLNTSPSINGFHHTLNSNGSILMHAYENSSGQGFTSDTGIVTDDWMHIAVVKDSSGNIGIFVDGELAKYGASGASGDVGNSTASLKIGTSWVNSDYLNGFIDALRLSSVARHDLDATYTVPTDFYSEPVITTPTVSSLSPINGSTNISLNTDLVVTFSENVTGTSGKYISIYDYNDDATPLEEIEADATPVSITDNVVTITPSISLSHNTKYYVAIDEDAFKNGDGYGNIDLTANTNWSFTTRPLLSLNDLVDDVLDEISYTSKTNVDTRLSVVPLDWAFSDKDNVFDFLQDASAAFPAIINTNREDEIDIIYYDSTPTDATPVDTWSEDDLIINVSNPISFNDNYAYLDINMRKIGIEETTEVFRADNLKVPNGGLTLNDIKPVLPVALIRKVSINKNDTTFVETINYSARSINIDFSNSGNFEVTNLVITANTINANNFNKLAYEASTWSSLYNKKIVLDNIYMQDEDYCDSYADNVLAILSNPNSLIRIEAYPNPAVEINDVITIDADTEDLDNVNVRVVRQHLKWDGALTGIITGRRYY